MTDTCIQKYLLTLIDMWYSILKTHNLCLLSIIYYGYIQFVNLDTYMYYIQLTASNLRIMSFGYSCLLRESLGFNM